MPLKNFKLKEQWGTTTLLLKQLLLKKKLMKTNGGEDIEKQELSHIDGGNAN